MLLRKNILWQGIAYHSLENCQVTQQADGFFIQSSVVGLSEGTSYSMLYTIHASNNWETRLCRLQYQVNGRENLLLLEKQENNWRVNGSAALLLAGCIDVDISVSPFTNTLPINRLGLANHQKAEIQVVYIDVLQGSFKLVRQQYQKLNESSYHYQNVPNDFEAVIEVDADGLVTDYPNLFTRIATHSY